MYVVECVLLVLPVTNFTRINDTFEVMHLKFHRLLQR